MTPVSIPRYRISEELYNGSRTLVYRGCREADSLPVVIKLLKNPYPSFSELVQFRNQYTIAKNLNSPSIVQTYSLEPYQNGYALVMEDFGGISLKEWGVRPTRQSLQEFLQVAIALCNTLDILYRERIIHKDIKPANILINPETKQVKLIDFSIASLLPRETQTLINPNVLEGTLAYISPEQTGRMNRGIDYRTDFYSLGVTFYELLTGKLPFNSNEPMELVHCHIAKLPSNLRERVKEKEISQVLCDIVSKLMAKNAEDRYQSALGLKFDLENCLFQLQETGSIEGFEIAQRDVCDRFIIPEKLYGRETEVNQLLTAFERVSIGSTEMMLVAGFSGIGKTAVVNEVHKPIVRQRGYFIKGKYDQFKRNIPFSAFVQAFRNLMGQLLCESDAQLQSWKTQILAAVGDNGQVLIDVIPELENIIGSQPRATEVSGSAAQNRFNLLLPKFVQIFTSIEHPLVMFLDDLQWADLASLNLLKLLMSETGHLLILGAYRDNEVSPAHPFILTVDELVKTGARVNTITLSPLSRVDLNQLVADTLNCKLSQAQPLTELVYKKTQGNPFFATQFLKALHDDKLISFNWEIQHWQCDLAQVEALAITDDVVEFMALQLHKLPTQTQEMLKLAACIGAQFDLNTLVIVSEKSAVNTATALWKALQEGLVIPTTKIYKFFTQSDSEEALNASANPTYRFLHDRVQQAAYSLIPDQQKTATHLKIGQLIFHSISPAKQQKRIFEIINHLNVAANLITTSDERQELAQLNLSAALKAQASAAYQAAMEYSIFGIELLDHNCWKSNYDLTLALHDRAATNAYLCCDFNVLEKLAHTILDNAKTLLDKMKVYEVKIQTYMAQSQLMEAIALGLQILALLGVHLPSIPTPQDVQTALTQTAQVIEGKNVERLVDLPILSDRHKLAIINFLGQMGSPAYQTSANLFVLVICQQVILSVTEGNSPSSAYAYVSYGIILSAVLNQIELGYQFGLVAVNLQNKFRTSAFESQVLFVFAATILYLKNHVRETLPLLEKADESGRENGGIQYAGYAMMQKVQHGYLMGKELSQIAEEVAIKNQVLAQLKQKNSANWNQTFGQAIVNLTGVLGKPYFLREKVEDYDQGGYEEDHLLSELLKQKDRTGLHYFYFNKMILAYLFDELDLALEYALKAGEYLDGVTGFLCVSVYYFYDALISLATWQRATKHLDNQFSEVVSNLSVKVQVNQVKIKEWADYAPMNYLHKWYLVEAEWQWVLGNKSEAIDLYDRAIAGAKANEYIQEEALANELAAKFYLDWGRQRIAGDYMIEAYYGYARWGAKAKVADLERRYPQLLAPILQQTRTALSVNETVFAAGTVTSSSSSTSVSDSLDLTAILKASQTLSGEIELDKLLSALLSTIIQTAGADKCVLMLLEDEGLMVQATAELIASNQIEAIVQPSPLPLQESREVPISLINSVKRSLQPAVINNATVHPQLTADAYIQTRQPKSILCSPILHQGKLLGMVYLENNLATGAFTSDRVELLNLLCAQAAISLENARLYEQSQTYAQQLEQALHNLQQTQLQMIQSEKMSALGNLVAGVAHEMNNPLGFIAASLKLAKPTFTDIVKHLGLYQKSLPNKNEEILDHAEEIDLDYSLEDLPKMIDSMSMACDRLKNISTSLRTFSRADQDYKVPFNIHEGIDSTILILKHRLKANPERPAIEVVTNYGNLPPIECFPGQLNQVFMNLIANAIDALDESNTGRSFEEIKVNPNCITITTSVQNNLVKIAIMDNGKGMNEEVKLKIFDHLFTTKAVGKGTGLGLAIARQIVEETHRGKLSFNSVLGQGTEFVIELNLTRLEVA